ncbi:Tropomodulin [Aphelenchoides fujianensis]|nr:Tropomodulin [Aphelenchoides fujianensis]
MQAEEVEQETQPASPPPVASAAKTNFYSEDHTIQLPKSKPAGGDGGGAKYYGRDLMDFGDDDIDDLLDNLTMEELEDLNNDLDPDNSSLPPSQRCAYHLDKEPTGPYQKEKLLKYLEDSAKNEKDWEESVPFNPGVKRGKIFEEDEAANTENIGPLGQVGGGKKDEKVTMPIMLDVDSEDDDYDTVVDKALDKAPEKDLVDLAGILGMHNVLNQNQYYNALKGKTQDENTGTTFDGIVKAYQPRIVPDEPENETDVDECIRRLEADDQALTEVNINNMKRISKERIRKLIRSACNSKHLTKLSLSNTAIDDQEARPLVELLENSPSLKVLNVESNFISPEMIAKMLRATLKHQSVIEFHAENQRQSVLGNPIEMDIMMSVEDNETLLRVGVSLQSMEARHRVSEALERNYERVRLRRLNKEA